MVFSPVSKSISTSEKAAPKEVYFRGMELFEPAQQATELVAFFSFGIKIDLHVSDFNLHFMEGSAKRDVLEGSGAF